MGVNMFFEIPGDIGKGTGDAPFRGNMPGPSAVFEAVP